jgi:hypothetical protein
LASGVTSMDRASTERLPPWEVIMESRAVLGRLGGVGKVGLRWEGWAALGRLDCVGKVGLCWEGWAASGRICCVQKALEGYAASGRSRCVWRMVGRPWAKHKALLRQYPAGSVPSGQSGQDPRWFGTQGGFFPDDCWIDPTTQQRVAVVALAGYYIIQYKS